MTNKEQIFKMIEEKTDTMQKLAVESIELIYNAGYNEGLEKAIGELGDDVVYINKLRNLKK